MPCSGTTWIGKTFDSHPNAPYRHEPNSSSALKPMPFIAPIADSHRHTRVKDSLIPLSICGYWTFSRGHFAYTKLNYLSSRFNFGSGTIASNQKRRRPLWNK
jgi:hypothetical protein